MAKGNSKAHSSQRRPGKSNKVTAVALTKPTLATPSATATHKNTVVQPYSGNTVWAICTSTSCAAASHASHEPAKAKTGTVSMSAKATSNKGKSQRNRGMGGVCEGLLTGVKPNANCTYLQ